MILLVYTSYNDTNSPPQPTFEKVNIFVKKYVPHKKYEIFNTKTLKVLPFLIPNPILA